MYWRSNKPVFIVCMCFAALVMGACQPQTTATATVPSIESTLSPTASPTSELTQINLILFSSYRDGESELYTMNADGSNLTRLTASKDRANQPTWSPDGRWIAFVKRFDGFNSEIMAMPFDALDGENPNLSMVRLTHSRALDVEPDWSPDGSQIAFTSTRSGNMHIWVMMANGSKRSQLTQDHNNGGSIWNSSPKWSPDGSKILFRSDLGQNNEIFIMNGDGTKQRNLTQHSASDVDPAWSPDGSQITFVSDRDGNEEIYIMDADGKNLQRLTNHFEKDTYPTWSPDGKRIAFYSMREGNYEVFVMNADGSEITQLTDHYNFDGFPAWQPTEFDSSSISISFEPDEGGYLPAPDPAVVSWIKKHAIPLNLNQTTSNEAAFDTLSKHIGDARTVDLANPYPGVQEALQIEKEIIEYLITQTGFDTLIFDIDWLKGVALDAYIHSGEGDPAQILADFPDPRWHSSEALEFIEKLRDHNHNFGDEQRLRAYGVRIPNPTLTMDIVLAYLETIDPEQKEHVEKLFACFRAFEDDWNEYYYAYLNSQVNVVTIWGMLTIILTTAKKAMRQHLRCRNLSMHFTPCAAFNRQKKPSEQ
ncbi:MAG: PD40 domain-containing protein [Anaerolineales bacterium]|nr:PD40 domain-containing protein [Chloroflexota bacterium]MBL6982609.1 PD40 domain-containing protein [Anaerolineales bacterium]